MAYRDQWERDLQKANARKKRRIDQVLCDRAKHLAAYYPLKEVAAALGMHPSQITIIKQRGWKAITEGRVPRARPDDFAERLAVMTVGELGAHYEAGNSTVLRWMKETPNRRASLRGDNLRRRSVREGDRTDEEVTNARKAAWTARRAKHGPTGRRARAETRATGEKDDV